MAETPSYLIPKVPKTADPLEEYVTRVTYLHTITGEDRKGLVIEKLGSMMTVKNDEGILDFVPYDSVWSVLRD